MNIQIRKPALVLTFLAGSALTAGTAFAQQADTHQKNPRFAQPERQTETNRQTNAARPVVRTLTFVKADTLLGSTVKNANDAKLGTIDDVVIDRGTGRILSVVLRDGGLLGIGGKLVAVPYSAFGYNAKDNALRLDVTPEMLEQAPELTTDRWMQFESDDWTEEMADTYREAIGKIDAEMRDAYSKGIRDAETERVSGTITKVERDTTARGDEQVIVHVRTRDGETRPVVLGPSWFVMSQNGAPMRGDSITAETYVLPRDSQHRVVARTATIDEHEVWLRNSNGTPRWNVEDSNWSQPSSEEPVATSPLLKLTDLVGEKAYARDDEGGEITDAVLELRSGNVAMLTLDPNDNFLGIGDELKCVPWSIAAVGEDAVRIDADREMLLNCESMPDEVTVFATPAKLEPVYKVFRVDVVEFEPRERRDWDASATAKTPHNWSGSASMVQAYRHGEEVQLHGTVKDSTSVDLGDGMQGARAIVVSTDEGDREVVIGPKWFVKEHDARFADGAEVTVLARKVRINDHDAMVATVINVLGGERVVFWENNEPVWESAKHGN